jgi:hypothetical protein
MSILDDAIREHLELKRAHGADDSELKKLEDDAFGPPQRPDEIDPFAEAPTEFLVSPTETPADAPGIGDEAARSGRRPDIADLQEAPPAPSEDLAPGDGEPASAEGAAPAAPEGAFAPQQEELVPAPDAPPPSPADAADVPLPPPADELPAPPVDSALAAPFDEAQAPADATPPVPPAEEDPADEHQIVDDVGPSTEERHAIADQPTQMFDVQAHVEAEEAEAPPAEQASPTDEQLIDAAQGEPQAAPPAPEGDAAPIDAVPEQEPLDTRGPDAEVAGRPPAEAEPSEEESAEYDFFNEQRLSDELDQALEAPLPPTDEHIAMPQYGAPPPAQTGIFDIETADYEEDPSEEVLRRHDTPAPPTEEAPRGTFDPPSEELDPPSEELEPPSQEFDPPSEEAPRGSAEPDSEETRAYDPDTGHEDILEDTPTFLEDAPDDDELWFEQKPPKDFDL